jgi:hypothetical protein
MANYESRRHDILWPLLVTITIAGCGEKTRLESRPPTTTDFPDERIALAASFAGRTAITLKQLLHDSVIIQPPAPDTARQGAPAISYMVSLARNTVVRESSLEPRIMVPEGPFVFEQGIWIMRTGDRHLRSSYTLRWRRTPERWKVVLWRWSLFR